MLRTIKQHVERFILSLPSNARRFCLSTPLHLWWVFLVVVHAYAQPVSLTSFLQKIPAPPQSVAEALQRCSGEGDTMIANALVALDDIELRTDMNLAKDSLDAGRSDISQKESNEIEKVQNQIDREKMSFRTALDSLGSREARQLWDDIRIIGEEVDKKITACPKSGKDQIYDSACVALAEHEGKVRRLEASQKFLDTVLAGWKPVFEMTSKQVTKQEELITKMLSATRNHEMQLRLHRMNLQVLHTVRELLKSVNTFSCLAAQVSTP